MKTHPRMLEWSCALVLCALGASTLACAFPTVPGRYGPSPDPPSGDELEDPPPPPGAERERIDEPDAPEEEPGEASPPEADQGAAVAEAPPPEPEEPALPPAPSDGDRITPVLERCQEGQAEACRRYALGALAVSTEPAVQSRAAMAMYRACEMGLGAACYEYALMVWMRAGANYDAAEIAYGFERARELDESRAGTGYGELIRPPEPGAPLREETLRHHEHACAMSLRQACDALAAAAEGPTAPEIVYEEIDLSASRGLTQEQARATLTEARPKLNACYLEALARDPEVAGTLVSTLLISPTGQVQTVHMDGSTLSDKEAVVCAGETLRALKFDPPSNKRLTTVVYMAELTTKRESSP